MNYPPPLEKVIEQFQKLPGIGAKSATRHTFALLKFEESDVQAFAETLSALHRSLVTCQRCHAIAVASPCEICESPRRDASLICVVEETDDMWAIERTGAYPGTYHVLGGVLSPLDGIGPDELSIEALLTRVGDATEIILATNPTTEGHATALYLMNQITGAGITVTQLAQGIPFGGDLEYVDTTTLRKALEGRRETV